MNNVLVHLTDLYWELDVLVRSHNSWMINYIETTTVPITPFFMEESKIDKLDRFMNMSTDELAKEYDVVGETYRRFFLAHNEFMTEYSHYVLSLK